MSILTKLCRDLPDDPARAIVAFANNVRRDLIEVGNWREVDPENFTAVINFIVEFCKRYSLPIDLSISRSGGQSEYGFMTAYVDKVLSSRKRLFEREVADEVNKMILEYDNRSSVESFGLARLNGEEKKRIQESISRIRSIIEESDLSHRKKNALFDRLNELSQEVDAHGTMTDRFFAFAGDTAFVLGDMAKKAKPLLDEVRAMLRVISRSRARQEGISLPPGDEVLRLPSPEQQE